MKTQHLVVSRAVGARAELCVVLLAASLCGCVPTSAHDRASVSRAVEQRTGLTLRDDATGTDVRLPPGVALTQPLSEDDAVAIALWNNGRFQSDLAALSLSRADLVEAGMIRNPLLTLLLPLGPKQLELTAWVPLEALWQRPRRVDAAQLEVERTATSLVQTALDFVRDVKLAWADALLAVDRARVARASVDVRGRLARIAEARRRAGDASEVELISARVDFRRQEIEAQRLSREEEAARRRLTALLGLPDGAHVVLKGGAPEPRDVSDAGESVKQALALRPDVRAAELSLDAARARGDAAVAASVPQVSVIADANGAGAQGFELGPGLQAEFPIFNQGQGPRARASAGVERAQWAWVDAQQRVANEVRQAHARYLASDEALTSLRRDVVSELSSATTRAAQAFEAGEASYLFVLLTTQQQLDVESREVELIAELRRSAAELDRSVGRKHVRAK